MNLKKFLSRKDGGPEIRKQVVLYLANYVFWGINVLSSYGPQSEVPVGEFIVLFYQKPLFSFP